MPSAIATVTATACLLSAPAFSFTASRLDRGTARSAASRLHKTGEPITALRIFAPPGSGYVRSDTSDKEEASLSHPELSLEDIDKISPDAFPDTYEPMLEYPGTMRPGKSPENMPYHDLPGLDIYDDDPVPWPYFQEIEWHHRWEPPHPQAMAVEDFIEEQGRWATVEEEAQLRTTMRRGMRERREAQEAASAGGAMVITDDEDEEEGEREVDVDASLGEGVRALLQGDDDEDGTGDEEDDDDDEGEDFLGALGLGSSEDDFEASEEEDILEDEMDSDFETGFDLDDDDEEDDDFNADLDDYTKEEDGGDDDEFDDGGFDYGD